MLKLRGITNCYTGNITGLLVYKYTDLKTVM